MDTSFDVETANESLTQNITSAAAPPQGSEISEDSSFPILPFLYLCMLALGCFYGNPIPDETHRRRRRRRRDGEKDIDPVERRKFVNAALSTKRVVGHDGCNAIALEDEETATAPPTPQEDGIDPAVAKEGASQAAHEAEDSSSCTICLEPYLIGEDVSWSRDMRCRHVFHHECVVEWLMKHDECPCCRAQYLPTEVVSRESQKEDDDASAASSHAPLADEDDNLNGGSMAFIIMSGLISSVRRARRRYTSIQVEDETDAAIPETVAGPVLNNGADAMVVGESGESDSSVDGSLTFGRVVLQKISSGLYNPIAQSNPRGEEEDEEDDIVLASEDDDCAEEATADVELGIAGMAEGGSTSPSMQVC